MVQIRHLMVDQLPLAVELTAEPNRVVTDTSFVIQQQRQCFAINNTLWPRAHGVKLVY